MPFHKTCLECKTEFVAAKSSAKYCCLKCFGKSKADILVARNKERRKYPLVSFGATVFLNNPKLKMVKDSSRFHWAMLFAKNLSKSSESAIINALSKQDEHFYVDLGLHYRSKNAQEMWAKSLK